MSSYSDLILAHGSLRAYYRLDDLALILNDVGPNNLDGTYAATGITYSSAGALANDSNTAVTFDGTSDPAIVPDNNALDLADLFSIEFWVKRSATQGVAQTLINKSTGAYQIQFTAGNLLHFFKTGTGGFVWGATTAITDQLWHHCVFTKNGSARFCYVDGADKTNFSTDRTCVDNTTLLRIGHFSAATARFPGSLDELALYGAVLTPEEVLQHYRTGAGRIQLADSVSPSESRGASPTGVRTDSVTASDSRTFIAGRVQADSIVSSDATALAPGKVLVDSASPTDTQTAIAGQAQEDTVTASDALSAADIVALGDSVSVTDQVSPNLLDDFTESVDDLVTVADSVALRVSGTSSPPAPGGWVPVIQTRTVTTHRPHFNDSVLPIDDLETDQTLSDIRREEELSLALN